MSVDEMFAVGEEMFQSFQDTEENLTSYVLMLLTVTLRAAHAEERTMARARLLDVGASYYRYIVECRQGEPAVVVFKRLYSGAHSAATMPPDWNRQVVLQHQMLNMMAIVYALENIGAPVQGLRALVLDIMSRMDYGHVITDIGPYPDTDIAPTPGLELFNDISTMMTGVFLTMAIGGKYKGDTEVVPIMEDGCCFLRDAADALDPAVIGTMPFVSCVVHLCKLLSCFGMFDTGFDNLYYLHRLVSNSLTLVLSRKKTPLLESHNRAVMIGELLYCMQLFGDDRHRAEGLRTMKLPDVELGRDVKDKLKLCYAGFLSRLTRRGWAPPAGHFLFRMDEALLAKNGGESSLYSVMEQQFSEEKEGEGRQ
jgi:hypothetical protein